MAKGKVEKTSSGNWGEFGGNNSMRGWSGTGTQTPGQSSQEGKGSKRGIEPKAGPSNVIGYSEGASNKDYAGTKEPGCSGPTKSGGNKKFAEGGSGHMWGNRGSRRMPEGQSGPNG